MSFNATLDFRFHHKCMSTIQDSICQWKCVHFIFFKQALQQIQVWRQYKISDIRLVISFQSNPTQKDSGPGQLLITMLRISGKLKKEYIMSLLMENTILPQTWNVTLMYYKPQTLHDVSSTLLMERKLKSQLTLLKQRITLDIMRD